MTTTGKQVRSTFLRHGQKQEDAEDHLCHQEGIHDYVDSRHSRKQSAPTRHALPVKLRECLRVSRSCVPAPPSMLRAHKQLVRRRIAAQLRTIPKAEIDRQSTYTVAEVDASSRAATTTTIAILTVTQGRIVMDKLTKMSVWKEYGCCGLLFCAHVL